MRLDNEDSYEQARRALSSRVGRPISVAEQTRVIELMRRRARDSSMAALYTRLQELERENARLRSGTHKGAT